MTEPILPAVDLFRPLALGRVLEHLPLVALDVGSRGGFESDLAAIAFAVDAVGFEPEPEAFARLRDRPKGPWRSLRHLPVALADRDGERILHVTRDPVSTSLLEPDPAIGDAFAKPQFFEVVKRLPIPCRTLDGATAEAGLERADYLKIDVEGAELDILAAAPRTLDSLLAVKSEVGFLRFRKGQPLAGEVEAFLRERGFRLMDFTGAAHWRRHGYVIHPQAGDGPVPYSRGRLMQGDFLFLRDPDTVAEPERLVRLAALAMAHGFIDDGLEVLTRPGAAQWLDRVCGLRPDSLAEEASRAYGRMVWRRAAIRHLRLLWTFGRSAVNLFLK